MAVAGRNYGHTPMLKLTDAVCIEAPAVAVWDRLAKLEEIPLWAKAVVRARCGGSITRGVGAERICELKGGTIIVERWVLWEEGRSFTYEGRGLPLVRHARNTWSVRPDGKHRTLLVSEAEVELRGGWFGRCFEPVMALVARRMGRHALAAFKHLVETGRPFTGRPSSLPGVRAAC